MQYYTFKLDAASQDLWTIITPFGKYNYTWLPMGLKRSPDIAQSVMENVIASIPDINVYIEDVGAFSTSWNNHLVLLDKVLCCLSDNSFTVNPL